MHIGLRGQNTLHVSDAGALSQFTQHHLEIAKKTVSDASTMPDLAIIVHLQPKCITCALVLMLLNELLMGCNKVSICEHTGVDVCLDDWVH